VSSARKPGMNQGPFETEAGRTQLAEGLLRAA
jgi:hypothetical protein